MFQLNFIIFLKCYVKVPVLISNIRDVLYLLLTYFSFVNVHMNITPDIIVFNFSTQKGKKEDIIVF